MWGVHSAYLRPFDPGQTPYFTRAESNANEKNPFFSLISIRFSSCEVRRLTPALRPDYMSRAGPLAGMASVCRDLGTFVKRNKNQLRDYMTTGPARFSAHRSSPAHVIRLLVRCSALFTINSRSSFHSLRMKCLGLWPFFWPCKYPL